MFVEIFLVGLLLLTVGIAEAVTGFMEYFSDPVMDSSWQVTSGQGRYSLTDNPGYLRYYFEGSRGSMGGWRNNYQASGGWNPSLTLIRPFDGENWTLITKANYNLRAHISGTSTGAQGQSFWIAFGEGTNDYLNIYRGVDWWYSSNVFTMELVRNGVGVANFSSTPSSIGSDGWVRESYWYEVTRNGEKITVRFSNDGISYTTAFSALLTEPVKTTQRAIIDMNLWNGVGSYVDWDYIYVEGSQTATQTTTPPITPATATPTTVKPTMVTPMPDIVTVPPTIVPPTAVPPKPVTTSGKFRVGPSITLRPVTDVIGANQDGIVELFMNNPSLNDVTLNVDARVSVPSGIHVYGESFGQAGGAGVVAGTFNVPQGTSRIITVVIKADKSARIGSHTIQFSGLYYPGDNKDAYNPLSLTYSVTVKEPSNKPEEPPKEAQAAANPPTTPGFGVVMAIFGVFAIARLLSRK